MGRIRFELWFATTAIALVAAGLSLPLQSAPLTEDEISAAVPMPEPANLPPPTISDIAPRPSTDQPTAATPAQTAPPAATRDATRPAGATPEIATPAVVTPPAVAPAEAPAPTIDQRVAIVLTPRETPHEYTLKLGVIGHPRSTPGIHRAAGILGDWLAGLHPEGRILQRKLKED